MSFWELFSIEFEWIPSTILLTIAFIIAGILGYILIYQQIRLVKAETMSIWDHVKCILYGLVFACGVTIMLTTLVAFRMFKKTSGDTSKLARHILWPLNFVIFLLYIFPLVDFLYMAHSDSNKGLTIFQEFFADKIIHRFEEKWKRYLIAGSLWIGLSVLPPIILFAVGIPFYIALMGWSFVYPIVIIAYLGNRGYVAGVVKNTYTHHTMKRSLHLTFDKSPRIFGIIFHRFLSTVMLIIQIVTYVVMIVVIILFTVYFLSGNIHSVKGTNFQTFAISLSFIFGIIGYFNRFWNKKIKFRWMDVLLSSWLIASVGINILVNFMILRLNKGLVDIFDSWSVTQIITQNTVVGGGNHVLFIPVALIEEVMFIILVNYYLFSKNSKYFLETRLNLLEFAGSKFMPIPLFNFVHHSNAQLRRAAKEELIQMYGRLPLRNDVNFFHKRYMNPLFDSICDSNRYNNEVAKEILHNLIKDHPHKICSRISHALTSGNVDMQIQVGLITQSHPESVDKIPSEILVRLFTHPNFRLKRIGAQLIASCPKQPQSLSKESVLRGLSDADYEYQGKCMEIATKFGFLTDVSVLLNMVKGSKPHLQQIAIQSFVGLLNRDDIELKNIDIQKILEELQNTDVPSRDAAIISTAKIKDLLSLKIPIEPFLSGIKSHIQTVRDASERVLRRLLPNMKSSELSRTFSTFITLSESADEETIQHILPLLAHNWKQYPQKVLSVLIKNLKSSNTGTQKAVEEALISIAIEDPKLVLNYLVPIHEERTYLTTSKLQRIIQQICTNNPKAILLLENYVRESNVTVKKNALIAMEELAAENASYFNQSLLLDSLKTEPIAEMRLKILSVLANVISHNVTIEKDVMNELLPLLKSTDRDVRKRVSTICIEIAQIEFSSLPWSSLTQLSSDSDPSIRESAAKILKFVDANHMDAALNLLSQLLQDEKWIVQSAVIDTLMHGEWDLTKHDLIHTIISMLDQPDEWLSRKVLEFILHIGKNRPESIPTDRVQEILSHSNPHIRSMALKITELLPFETSWEVLRNSMQDTDAQVREQASRSLVTLSKNMSVSELYSYTLPLFGEETNILLQRSLADALQRILKYETTEIKQRLVGILKIRCKLSQDPVLCQIWHELEEK